MDQPHLLAFCTCPSRDVAEGLARQLVERSAAACVNVLPGLTSIYRWQGSVHADDECLLLIKTSGERYPELERLVRELHPYELPELIAVGIERGLPSYLQWIAEQTQTRS